MNHNKLMFDQRFIRPDFAPARSDPCFCGSGKRFKRCCGLFSDDRPPPFGVGLVRQFLNADECHDWVAFAHAQDVAPLDVYALDHSEETGYAQSRSANRVTDQVSLGLRRLEMNELLARALRDVVEKQVSRTFSWFEKPQMLSYLPGGYFKKHADAEFRIPGGVDWVKNVDRDISILLYLNDDFAGGDLLFNHFNYFHRPRAGDLLFFPSDHRYEHEARPLKTGRRFVVVSWAAFSDEPRTQGEQMPGNVPMK